MDGRYLYSWWIGLCKVTGFVDKAVRRYARSKSLSLLACRSINLDSDGTFEYALFRTVYCDLGKVVNPRLSTTWDLFISAILCFRGSTVPTRLQLPRVTIVRCVPNASFPHFLIRLLCQIKSCAIPLQARCERSALRLPAQDVLLPSFAQHWKDDFSRRMAASPFMLYFLRTKAAVIFKTRLTQSCWYCFPSIVDSVVKVGDAIIIEQIVSCNTADCSAMTLARFLT